MGKTPEAKVRDPTVDWAKAHNIGHQRMSFRIGVKQGFPDDVFLIYPGVTVWHEYKRPGGKPTPLQLRRIKALQELGFDAEWFDNSDKAITHLAEIVYKVRNGVRRR